MLRFILVMESLGKDVMVIDVGKCMGGCIELVIIKVGNVFFDVVMFCIVLMFIFFSM